MYIDLDGNWAYPCVGPRYLFYRQRSACVVWWLELMLRQTPSRVFAKRLCGVSKIQGLRPPKLLTLSYVFFRSLLLIFFGYRPLLGRRLYSVTNFFPLRRLGGSALTLTISFS